MARSGRFKDVRAAMHENHGLLPASRHSIDQAALRFIALERACQQPLLVEATGIEPTMVTPERSRYRREHVGSPFIGGLHFQTIYDPLVAQQPDMSSKRRRLEAGNGLSMPARCLRNTRRPQEGRRVRFGAQRLLRPSRRSAPRTDSHMPEPNRLNDGVAAY